MLIIALAKFHGSSSLKNDSRLDFITGFFSPLLFCPQVILVVSYIYVFHTRTKSAEIALLNITRP